MCASLSRNSQITEDKRSEQKFPGESRTGGDLYVPVRQQACKFAWLKHRVELGYISKKKLSSKMF